MSLKRVVVIATVDVPADYPLAGLERHCMTEIGNQCRAATGIAPSLDSATDMGGFKIVQGRRFKCRRIGVAGTIRVAEDSNLRIESLRLKCQDGVEDVLKTMVPVVEMKSYIAAADNGMEPLAAMRRQAA
jgi:hypothetical protein